MRILGTTRDDAAGECFDKVARVLGMPYPGGAALDRQAKLGDDEKYPMPHSHVAGCELDMSFSGLKTAALNLIHNAEQKGETLDIPSLCASFSKAVSDTLVAAHDAGAADDRLPEACHCRRRCRQLPASVRILRMPAAKRELRFTGRR